MEEDLDDVSGSDYDSISDLSSLGSYADQYAVQQVPQVDEAALRAEKRAKRKSIMASDTPEGAAMRRKSVMKKKRMSEARVNIPPSDPVDRKEARKTKLKGLNERVLGMDDDMFSTEDSKADFEEPTQSDLTSHAVKSLSEAVERQQQPPTQAASPASGQLPVQPQQQQQQQQQQEQQKQQSAHPSPTTSKPPSRVPSRDPSPKINLFGSSRVSPLPPEATAGATLETADTTNEEFTPHSDRSAGATATSRPGSSNYGGTGTEPGGGSHRGSFSSAGKSTGGIPSAVSERRKAAAAARAARNAKMSPTITVPLMNGIAEATTGKIVLASSSAPTVVPVTQARGSSNSATTTELQSPGHKEYVKSQEKAVSPSKSKSRVLSKAKSSRRAGARAGSSSDDDVSDESEDFSSSGEEDESSSHDERWRKRQKRKEREKRVKEKEKEKEREKRTKEKEKEKSRKAAEVEKEKAAFNNSRKEKGINDVAAPERTTHPDIATAGRAPPMLSTASAMNLGSFGRSRNKEPFCRQIKSTTYLNAIKIVQGEIPKVLCASADSTIQIYSIVDGTALTSLVGHTDRVISLAVSNPFMYADKSVGGTSAKPIVKTLVASGSRDEQLRIWDLDTGKCLHSIHAHKSPIWAVAVAVRPKGDVIVLSTSGDGSMRSWDGKTGKKINNFKGHTDKILTVFIMNPLGESPLVLSAGSDKRIRVWELLTGAHIRMFEGHEDEINSVVAGSFSGIASLVPIGAQSSTRNDALAPGIDPAKATVVVSASKDLTVRVWDFKSGHLLFELLGHNACVYEVGIIRARDAPAGTSPASVIPTGTPIIASCSEDATVKLWNLVTGKLIKSVKWHSVSVRGLDVASVVLQAAHDPSNSTALIASCGWDKTIQFHELGETLYAKRNSMCAIM